MAVGKQALDRHPLLLNGSRLVAYGDFQKNAQSRVLALMCGLLRKSNVVDYQSLEG